MQASERLNMTFAALADPTRRAIMARLALGEASVAELAAPFNMSQPAISKHLKVLETAGLISTGQDANKRPRKIEGGPMQEAVAWLEGYRKFWERRYEALDALLGQMEASRPKSRRKRRQV
ncbi:MAG TPA: metalloregulator ArsR/SmtB family transcription factor [Gemmatimonadaceae bacterium]|jgi:DNA-binding transcriptional ArsR family regulator|nr:metalloregulator ArsR/SmtB family transcription factor [Gemmatimonadaceae bacterium]